MNVEMLRKLAKKLRRIRHEEHYDQGEYAAKTQCGTTACIAGHAVLMEGYKLKFDPDDYEDWTKECVTPAGRTASIHSQASKLLGLGYNAAYRLFSGEPFYDWPEEYSGRLDTADPKSKDLSKRPSRIAADLLDAIADGKVKL